MDHDWVVKMLGERIDDRAFLGLIRKWLKAGILDTDGAVYEPDEGTPQGGIISPVLANIYLHDVLDLWVERLVKPRCRGQVLFVKELNRRLIGHYNDYGLRGNASDLWRFYHAAVVAAYKWLNRRGGKRASFTWAVFLRALKRLGAARPRITEQSMVRRELVLV
jgi:retron-type reverse transcriptase